MLQISNKTKYQKKYLKLTIKLLFEKYLYISNSVHEENWAIKLKRFKKMDHKDVIVSLLFKALQKKWKTMKCILTCNFILEKSQVS